MTRLILIESVKNQKLSKSKKMKTNILKPIILLAVLATLAISCSNNENIDSSANKNLDISQLTMDPLFIEFLSIPDTYNSSRLASINSETKRNSEIEITEISQLTEIFGFNNDQETINFINKRSQIFEELNKKYNLENYSTEELIVALGNDVSQYRRYDCKDSCERTMKNDAGIASATVIAAHAGCFALDTTVIGGIICHGAAHAIYAFSIDEIDNQYNKCLAECDEKDI